MRLRFSQSLPLVLYFASWIPLSSSYDSFGFHQKSADICGGHCRGNGGWARDPCSLFVLQDLGILSQAESERCKWANDHCCPPNGDGSQWTTTTTTTTTTRRSILSHGNGDTDDSNRSSSGDNGLPIWAIVLIVLFILLALVSACFRCYYIMSVRERAMMGGGIYGGGYGYGPGPYGGGAYVAAYPGTAATMGMY